MSDRTSEALTDDELREIIAESAGDLLAEETIAAMARELLANRARIAELEAAQRDPDAYVAVKRKFSPNAAGPEWLQGATVIDAGDAWGLGDHEKNGYQLLPIVGTETGTRVTAPQPVPAGYLVGWQGDDGQVRIELDEAENIVHGVNARAYAVATAALAFVAELAPADPSTEFNVYELRKAADRA